VALLAEETGTVGSAVARQLLRARRSFVATLMTPAGDVMFRVRRPLYLINSTTTIEGPDGEPFGAVVQSWHPLRRRYDLFLDGHQFAEIDAPMLAWEFVLRDGEGKTLALIDRNFIGLGKELFTDAGRYAVHYGTDARTAGDEAARVVVSAGGRGGGGGGGRSARAHALPPSGCRPPYPPRRRHALFGPRPPPRRRPRPHLDRRPAPCRRAAALPGRPPRHAGGRGGHRFRLLQSVRERERESERESERE
jgi:uncharacterized protein YxjI